MYIFSRTQISFSVAQGLYDVLLATVSNHFGFVYEHGSSAVTTGVVIFVRMSGSVDKLRSASRK
jgi:hypothetical protein